MDFPKLLNITGLIINISGTLLMFYYSPKIESRLFLYKNEEYIAKHKIDVFKNKMMRFGIILLFVGFLLQLTALIF